MSHIVKIDLEIKDLDSLQKAADLLNLEFVQGQTSYKWYGRSISGDPLPEGLTAADLGSCDHVLRVKGNPSAYEVGIRRNASGSYSLLWDFWQGGFGLQAAIGQNGGLLKQAYACRVAQKTYQRQGYRVNVSKGKDGSLQVIATK